MMSGKFIFLSFFFLATFFRISHSKRKCYGGIECKFSPAETDSPDLKKCEQKDCQEGEKCVRKDALGVMNFGGAASVMTGGATVMISLGCGKGENKNCGELNSKGGENLCVCDKDLCNSASNIIPNYYLLPLWTFVTFLFKGMNV